MSDMQAKHSLALADGVAIPGRLASNRHTKIKWRTVSGHKRQVITIYGVAAVDFVHGGLVIVELSGYQEPVAILAKQDVLFIEYCHPGELKRIKLNYLFCVECATNTGEARMYMPRPSGPSPLYECVTCDSVWGQDLPSAVLDQV